MECTCCVCLELVKAPRILSCGHHLCLQCTRSKSIQVQQNTSTNNNNNNNSTINTNNLKDVEVLRCPLCHKLTKVQDLREEVKNQINPGNDTYPYHCHQQRNPSQYLSFITFTNMLLLGDVLCGHCEKESATRECLDCVRSGIDHRASSINFVSSF